MLNEKYVPDRGDLVWLSLDPQAGHEQAGRRPAVILSTADYNRRGMAVLCPITNKVKGYPFEVAVPPGGAVTGVILADQIKNQDWRIRRAELITQLDEETVNNVVELILPLIDPHEVFGSSNPEPE